MPDSPTMRFFQFEFTRPGSTLKIFVAAQSFTAACDVIRETHLYPFSADHLKDAMETTKEDAQADGQFITANGWIDLRQEIAA